MRFPYRSVLAAGALLSAFVSSAGHVAAADGDSDIKTAFDDVSVHVAKRGYDPRVLQMLPVFQWPVRVSNERATPEIIQNIATAYGDSGPYEYVVFSDRTFRPAQAGQACLVVSTTTQADALEKFKQFVNFPWDNESGLDAQELALFFFLHELRHCAQPVGSIMRAVLETDADAFAIGVIKTLNPQSRIEQVVKTLRSFDFGYMNVLPLSALLKGEAPPPFTMMLHAYHQLSSLSAPQKEYLAAKLRFMENGISGVEPEFALDIATTLAVLDQLPETPQKPVEKVMRDILVLRVRAYEFLNPSLLQRTIVLMKKYDTVRAHTTVASVLNLP